MDFVHEGFELRVLALSAFTSVGTVVNRLLDCVAVFVLIRIFAGTVGAAGEAELLEVG